jgi:hypothetical protein
MFSSFFFQVFGLQVKLASFFGGAPFNWDEKTRCLIVHKGHKLRRFNFVFLGGVLITAYLGVTALQTKLWGNPSDFNFAMTFFICGLFDTAGLLIFRLDPHSFAAAYNSLLLFARQFNRKRVGIEFGIHYL